MCPPFSVPGVPLHCLDLVFRRITGFGFGFGEGTGNTWRSYYFFISVQGRIQIHCRVLLPYCTTWWFLSHSPIGSTLDVLCCFYLPISFFCHCGGDHYINKFPDFLKFKQTQEENNGKLPLSWLTRAMLSALMDSWQGRFYWITNECSKRNLF